MSKINSLQNNVLNWANRRGILAGSDAKSQLLKTVSEIGELADAVNKGDVEEAKDAIGDVLVTLVLLNYFAVGTGGLTDRLAEAFAVISDRSGSMVGGVFVKDEKGKPLTEVLTGDAEDLRLDPIADEGFAPSGSVWTQDEVLHE